MQQQQQPLAASAHQAMMAYFEYIARAAHQLQQAEHKQQTMKSTNTKVSLSMALHTLLQYKPLITYGLASLFMLLCSMVALFMRPYLFLVLVLHVISIPLYFKACANGNVHLLLYHSALLFAGLCWYTVELVYCKQFVLFWCMLWSAVSLLIMFIESCSTCILLHVKQQQQGMLLKE